jgi:dTDP-4-amino-4,6-dideoxygalactose transaminase
MYRIGQEEIDEVAKVIRSKQLFRVNNGLKEVENFERELAEKFGAKYALCVSGGTAAITCALVGLGVGPGDEVILPAYTFMATALAVTSVGAVPVLAEVDETMTIDLDDVERKMTGDVKAVIPVDMVGFPCDMKRLDEMREKYGFKIVEDACQANGGSFGGKRLGLWGDAGTFSFNDFKIITAGEGGAIITDDRRVYERAMIYHDGGVAFRPYAGDIMEPFFMGTQYRVSEITGAILRVQLRRLDGIIDDLRRVKKAIMEGLRGAPNIRFAPSHDPEGDCATTLAFTFENERAARKFAAGIGAEAWLPIDSGKHVYYNWDPLMAKRGAHCDAMNPFNLPQNKRLRTNYSKDMCPGTVDALSRTVYISLHPDWPEEKVSSVIGACRKAAAEL